MPFIRRRGSFLALGAAVVLLFQARVGTQTLVFSLFETYLQQLQVQAGIPGLSAAILQDQKVIWSAGLGQRSVEGSLPATADTPYAIADLTQTITAALVLYCVERGQIRLSDPIGRWVPTAESPTTTLQQLLSHAGTGTTGGFRYSPSRFALLAHPVEQCMGQPFRKVVARDVFDLLSMRHAVPGYDLSTPTPEFQQLFDEATLTGYAALLQRMALPYKLDRNRRPVRSQFPFAGIDGSLGAIASVLDLAEFDKGLPLHLRPETMATAFTNTANNGVASPFGLGWFVQTYQGEKLVWHFGYTPDTSSSLMLKVPGRRLTLILLANSDGLSAPYSFTDGDVTSSHFARTFLRLFL
jgi:CubicO group peptidase (beta-lactamase class C family)